MVVLALVPILQLFFLACWGHSLTQQGVNLYEIIADPPADILVMMPMVAVGVAALLAGWVGVLALRKSASIVHVTICQVVLLVMAVHLTLVILRTSRLSERVQSARIQPIDEGK